MNELGQILREAREARGISLAEAEDATKIRRKYLQALEESNFDALPPGIYARGFLRNYARYLGLNPEELLAVYGNGTGLGPYPAEPRILSEPLERTPRISWEIVAGVVMLALVGVLMVVVYRRYIAPLAGEPAAPTPTVAQALGLERAPSLVLGGADPTATPEPSPTPSLPPTATPTPVPLLVPTLTPAVAQALVLQVAATADSWVRVTLDGEIVFQGILGPGEQRTWTAEREIGMRVGNAGGLVATVGDQELGVLGASGEVLDFLWRLSDDGKVLTITPAP